ncbi:EamA family transporter [Candidatus Woesearchaeota archaeon]|nr:EamA family transporter [Candidatus Woesearchaeota archaeon]
MDDLVQWWVYAVGSALFSTAFSLSRKRALLKMHSMNLESTRTLAIAFFCIFLIPFINLNIEPGVFFLIYGTSVLSTIGILFASKALRHEAVSLIAPLSNLRPGIVAVLAFLFLGEILNTRKIIGIGVLVLAAYLLESDHHFSDFIAPIKHLMRDKYSKFFLFAIGLFGALSVLNKYLVSNYVDIFTLYFLTWIFIAINFNLAHSWRYGFKDTINCFKELSYLPILIGGLSMIMNLLYLKAISITYVSLVSPIVMLSTLFIVFIGGNFFHEKYIYFRFFVSILMIAGAYLIII